MSEDSRRLPPQYIEAEMSILGAIFLDNEAIHKALETVSTDDFYRESHRKLFAAMVTLSDKDRPIDLITMVDALKKQGDLEDIGGAAYLATLVDYVPTAANIAYYCNIVKERALNRRMIQVGNELSSLGYAEETGAGELLESAMMKLTVAQKREPVDAPTLVQSAVKRLRKRWEGRGTIQGIPYGFPALDEVTCGMQRGDLIIIAGRPSMGKSALVGNVLENISGSGYAGMLFSLEMSKENYMDRVLASSGGIRYSNIRSGNLWQSEWSKITRACETISRFNLRTDDTPAISLREIRSKARKQKRSGLDVLAVDYLQLMSMSADRNTTRSSAIGEVTRGLKQLSRELDCVVILLSQLSRDLEKRNDKRPMMSDLRESGEIEQDADVILFPFRPSVYCPKCKDKTDDGSHNLSQHQSAAEVIIGKQRNGESNISVPLVWMGEFQRFEGVSS